MGKLALSFLGVCCLAAPAWADPDFPVLEAKLIELSRSGREVVPAPEVRLAANKNRDSKDLSSFDLTQIKPVPCPRGAYCILGFIPVTTNFRVVRITADKCGSRRYEALSKSGALTVLDHASRKCDDYKKFRWEVTLRELRGRARYFAGNPEPVRVAQACDVGNHICPMYYMPATCRAEGTNFSASGGNSCDARYQLEDQLCLAGLDPASYNITCSSDLDP